MYVCMYIYIYICVCVYVYIYIKVKNLLTLIQREERTTVIDQRCYQIRVFEVIELNIKLNIQYLEGIEK